MEDLMLLDINDCGLSLWRGAERVLHSPGYAYLQGREYQYGERARGQARLHPREINHRFWWQLNTEPLQPGFGPARHSADLAHGHLVDMHKQAGQPAQLMMAVPGSMQRDQLSLLLGIVEHCPFDVVGLVDRAIASVAHIPLEPQSHYLELQLHQALITHMSVSQDQVQRDSVIPIPGCGWLAVQDSLAQAIADAFIRQTRFDPRRKAATEQQLYDKLPQILQQLAQRREYNLELDGHHVRLDQDSLTEACSKHYQRIMHALPGPETQLLLDPTVALLPGLDKQFSNTAVAESGNLGQSVEQHRDIIAARDGDIHFITSLPVAAAQAVIAAAPEPIPEPAPAPPPPPPLPKEEPSSYRIEYTAGRFTLYPGTGEPPKVNGTQITAALQLRPGDSIEVAGGEVLKLQTADTGDGAKT